MRFQVVVSWVVTPCSVVVRYENFGGPCYKVLRNWFSTTLHGVTTQTTTT